jgi:hypothetical protein
MRPHPDPRAEINISAETHRQLLAGVFASGLQQETWEITEQAIDEWTRRHNPEALAATAYSGYQWKQLFLPSGTVLRTVFGGKNFHCTVDGDQILFQGQPVSPSGFVNAAGGIRRNAWRCAWILFPGTTQWALADTLRLRDGGRARTPRQRAVKPAATSPPPACGADPVGTHGVSHSAAAMPAAPLDVTVNALAALLQQALLPILKQHLECNSALIVRGFQGSPPAASAYTDVADCGTTRPPPPSPPRSPGASP